MIEWLHPAAVFLGGAILLPFLSFLRGWRGRGRAAVLLAVPVVAFVDLLLMEPGRHGVIHISTVELVFGRVDRLSLVFAYVFVIMAFLGNLYGVEGPPVGHQAAGLLYAGGALGVVFSGDYLTLYIFWEVMAFSSVFLIWYQPGRAAAQAGFRYLMVHIFAGVCLLGGIVLEGVQTGSWTFGPPQGGGLAWSLILVGFLFNAAAPPLHAWLADAYPEATVWGGVFLSAFTTKTAVYVLIRAFAGTELLVWLGAVMAIYGVVYAVLENDIRRLLAYHIISQVGYMVAGVGLGTPMALNGTVAHAFSHILYKGLLFMGTGAVIHVTGRRRLTELGGLYTQMPWTFLWYMIGGLSISAFPLFSGFVSKAMVVAAAEEQHRAVIWLMLTLASSGTFLHTGLKLPYFTFLSRDAGLKAHEPPRPMLWAMGLTAALCIGIGVLPQALYRLLPYPVDFAPYSASHVVWTLQLLLATAVGFLWFLARLGGEPTVTLDTDWVYRRMRRPLALAADRAGRLRARLSPDSWGDWLSDLLIVGPLLALSRRCLAWDLAVIDAAVTGSARTVYGGGRLSSLFEKYVIYGIINTAAYANHVAAAGLRRVQSGLVHHYALMMALGLLLLVTAAMLLGLP